MPKFIRTILPHAILTMLVIGVATAYAWTAPTQSPPNGNVAAPVNVGSVDQVKSAGLGVTNLIANQICFGADCRSSWQNLVANTLNAAVSVTAPRFCIGGSCITAWPVSSPPSSLVYSCPNIAYQGCSSACAGNLSLNSTCTYSAPPPRGSVCVSGSSACTAIGHLVP